MQIRYSTKCLIFIAAILAVTACSNWTPATCGNGDNCPPNFMCNAAGDACISIAQPCGNKKLDVYDNGEEEVCDDGNNRSGDGCSADCDSKEFCGNGIRDEAIGEECDPPVDEPDDGCSPDCKWFACGNRFVDTGEECEDGNNQANDGCANCKREFCGDGTTQSNEGCDDGNSVPGDGCSDTCLKEKCGNGILDPTDFCDDGNKISGDGCSANCDTTEICGNGITDPPQGEACDCGVASVPRRPSGCSEYNSDTEGYCNLQCQLNCGDGTRDKDEACDTEEPSFCLSYDNGLAKVFDIGSVTCELGCQGVDTERCKNINRLTNGSITDGRGILRGAWALDGSHLFAVGNASRIRRWTGIEWVTETFNDSNQKLILSDVWGGDLSNIFAVGAGGTIIRRQSQDPQPPNVGTWSKVTCGTEREIEDLHGVWGSSIGDVYAVGDAGMIVHLDFTKANPCVKIDNRVGKDLFDIWGRNPNDIYAVGAEGTILHYDGSSWNPIVATGVTENLYGVWGHQTDVYAVGDSGTILRCSACIGEPPPNAWQSVPPITGARLLSVWGNSANDIFVAGQDGTLLHYDGNWAPVRSQKKYDFHAVWTMQTQPAAAIAVGEAGTVLHFTY